jgi:hypothetical protein
MISQSFFVEQNKTTKKLELMMLIEVEIMAN